MKILILGARGMLGQELSKVFQGTTHELVLWDKVELDITQQSQVETKISSLSPDVVINAAAYTAVDQAENEPELVYLINAQAVSFIAQICTRVGALLIHFSTDYVFDGECQSGYVESDMIRQPVTVYGKSKKMAEDIILQTSPTYYIIRTQWLFGAGGKNFIETMLRLCGEGKSLKVVNDQIGSPTYAVDLAQQVKYLLETRPADGVYHITNSGVCSWYDFAQEIFRQCKLTPEISAVSSEEFITLARRPKFSMLCNTKISPLRTWQEALTMYLRETGRIVE